MKKSIKTIILSVTVLIFCLAQIIPVCAYYDKIQYLSAEEIYNEVWNMYYSTYIEPFEDTHPANYLELEASIARYELEGFIDDYEPSNPDVTVADVNNEFYDYYYNQLYGNIEMDIDDDGNIYEYDINNPVEKHYWAYNETNDKFVCTDDNNKIIKSYDRYVIKTGTSGQTKPDTSGSTSRQKTTSNGSTAKQAEIVTTEPEETIMTNYATTYVADSTEPESTESKSMNTAQIIILCILGVVIVAGIAFVGVTAIKKKGK